jgi:hypothetical protein
MPPRAKKGNGTEPLGFEDLLWKGSCSPVANLAGYRARGTRTSSAGLNGISRFRTADRCIADVPQRLCERSAGTSSPHDA